MFHALFKTIIEGGALGKVDHYCIKKEYQARGAPHYHFLLWIHDAPVAGVDPPEKVLAWIEKRITCQIPNKDKEPELYDLLTRYQMHKCSAYCKKPKKCGTMFVKKCKVGLPRPVRDTSCLNCAEDSLKTKGKLSPQTHRGRSQNQRLQPSAAESLEG